MSTRDLIGGYAAYTSARDLGLDAADSAPAITPTTTVTGSSAFCVATATVTIDNTFDHNC